MKSITHILLFLTLIFLCSGLFAQEAENSGIADEIETLLAADALTYAQAARFILEASDALVTGDPLEAFNYAKANKLLPKKAEANLPARLDGVSLLLLKSFNLKGGLFYTMTKSPHYAYREMEYKNLFQTGSYPGMNVSGKLMLFLTGRMLEEKEQEI